MSMKGIAHRLPNSLNLLRSTLTEPQLISHPVLGASPVAPLDILNVIIVIAQ